MLKEESLWRQALAAMPPEYDDLMLAVYQEIRDEEFLNLRHGERHTRNKGCTGPLCKKALRDWQRERTAAACAARGVTPRAHRRSKEMMVTDALLVPIKAAHDNEFRTRKLMDPEELQAAGLMNQLVA